MKKIEKKAFSLIELLIAMFIFFIGILSVYAIISSTTKLNNYNKDYIIASNLAREQVELIRNIRDTNFAKIQNYKMINPNLEYSNNNIFKTGSYYKVENDFSNTSDFSVKVEETSDFVSGKENLTTNTDYKICLNDENLYVFCSSGVDFKNTSFYKFTKIEEVPDNENAFKVISKVIWINNGYHEFEIQSILSDYKIF